MDKAEARINIIVECQAHKEIMSLSLNENERQQEIIRHINALKNICCEYEIVNEKLFENGFKVVNITKKEFEKIYKSYLQDDKRALDEFNKALEGSKSKEDKKQAVLSYIDDLAHMKSKYECVKMVDDKFMATKETLMKSFKLTKEEVDKKLSWDNKESDKPIKIYKIIDTPKDHNRSLSMDRG